MKEPPELPPHPSRPDEEKRGIGYQQFAETVGCVPSLRKRDNIIQGIVVLITSIAGALICYPIGGVTGILGGLLMGLVIGTLGSGLVLMVLGWIRAAKRRK